MDNSLTAIRLCGLKIYWTNNSTGTIGWVNLNGSHVSQSFIIAGGPAKKRRQSGASARFRI